MWSLISFCCIPHTQYLLSLVSDAQTGVHWPAGSPLTQLAPNNTHGERMILFILLLYILCNGSIMLHHWMQVSWARQTLCPVKVYKYFVSKILHAIKLIFTLNNFRTNDPVHIKTVLYLPPPFLWALFLVSGVVLAAFWLHCWQMNSPLPCPSTAEPSAWISLAQAPPHSSRMM